MILDLQILIYSYLTLEELLTSTKDNHKLRDIALKRYHPNLPTIEACCQNGNLETFIYLYDRGYKYDLSVQMVTNIIDSGNLKLLEYTSNNILGFGGFFKNYLLIDGIFWISQFIRDYSNTFINYTLRSTNNQTLKIKILKLLFKLGCKIDPYNWTYFIKRLIESQGLLEILKLIDFPHFSVLTIAEDTQNTEVYNYIYDKYINDKEIMHWKYSSIDLSFMEYL